MKIAIAVISKKQDSEISSQGGRAPYYLLFDEKEEFLEIISNPFTIGGGGAGIAVAKMLADKNVDVVIAGAIGANMASALEKKGIEHYEKQGIATVTLKEVIKVVG